MAIRTDAAARQTYLVEHYAPGFPIEGLRQWAARVRETAVEMEREGNAVRVLRSTIVPADESLLCLLEAASEELVREILARAGVPFERLSTAVSDGDEAVRATTAARRRAAEKTGHSNSTRGARR